MDSVFRLLSHDKRGYPVGSKLLLVLRPYAYGEDVYMDDISGNLGEDVVVEWRERYGEDVPIVAYMIPESMQAEMFAIFGEGLWFDAEGIAKQVNIIELAQSPEINQWAVWYPLDAAAGIGNREVLFYDPDTLLESDVAKIAARFREPGATSYPSAFFNGLDFRLATYTGGPTYAADNRGVLLSPGANLPAEQGMRLATTLADGAVLGPELIPSLDLRLGSTINTSSVGVNSFTTTTNGGVYNLWNLPIGKKYQIVFARSTTASGGCDLYSNIINSTNLDLKLTNGPGIYTVDISRPYLYVRNLGEGDTTGVSISIKEVIPTYVTTDSSGNPIIASTPQKTITYSEDWTAKTFAETFDKFDISDPLKAPGWLCEPVRTNYALNSATPATHTTGSLAIGTYTLWQEGTGSIAATAGTAVGTFGTANNGTPATITITTAGTVVLTASGTNTWVQLELGAFKTSRIYTTSAPMVRAATIPSFLTAGKIPVNDFAIRMIVVPRARGQAGYLLSGYTDGQNRYRIYISGSLIAFISTRNSVESNTQTLYTHLANVPIEIIVVRSSIFGTQLSYRQFASGIWSSFVTEAVNSTSAAKDNLPSCVNYQLGAINSTSQFTGNISLFDCVPIPSGTTDPMAWAKTHWGVA